MMLHPDMLIMQLLGQHEEVIKTLRVELARRRDTLGLAHDATRSTLAGLYVTLSEAGDKYKEEAADMIVELLQARQMALGSNHADTFTALCEAVNVLYEASPGFHHPDRHVGLDKRSRLKYLVIPLKAGILKG